MRYNAVLFDLDGTLTESEPGIIKSVQYALEKMNAAPLSQDALRAFIGPPLFESFQRLAGLSESDATLAIALYRERFEAVGWRENSVYPGIPRLLRSLKRRGTRVALATAKPQVFAERIARHFGFWHLIDRIEAVSLHDHHADKAALVARALSGFTGRACMVGDRAADMQGAIQNGIDAIGAGYGYGEPGELEAAGARFVARSVRELTEYLLDGDAVCPGFFVSFEGSDGCGKTTQLQAAAQWLTECGYETVITREPGGSPVSECIRELVLDVQYSAMTPRCEALLFAAARAEHVTQVIEPGISRGAAVLTDRYVDSSIAYQGAGRELGMELVRRINDPAIQGRMPDMTLFFDVDPMQAIARRGDAGTLDRLEQEDDRFIVRVYQGYRQLAAQSPDRIRRVDAGQPIDAVREQVKALFMELVRRG